MRSGDHSALTSHLRVQEVTGLHCYTDQNRPVGDPNAARVCINDGSVSPYKHTEEREYFPYDNDAYVEGFARQNTMSPRTPPMCSINPKGGTDVQNFVPGHV